MIGEVPVRRRSESPEPAALPGALALRNRLRRTHAAHTQPPGPPSEDRAVGGDFAEEPASRVVGACFARHQPGHHHFATVEGRIALFLASPRPAWKYCARRTAEAPGGNRLRPESCSSRWWENWIPSVDEVCAVQICLGTARTNPQLVVLGLACTRADAEVQERSPGIFHDGEPRQAARDIDVLVAWKMTGPSTTSPHRTRGSRAGTPSVNSRAT